MSSRDSALAIALIFLLLVGLPMVLLRTRDRVRDWRRRKTPEQIQAGESRRQERLLNPKPSDVEARIGGLLPKHLINLYEDRATVLSNKVEIRPSSLSPKEFGEWIEEFLPLDFESQTHRCDLEGAGWGRGFCFAADGAGNFYWVPVGSERVDDTPVFFACHDPWGNEKIADSLQEFLSWPRVSHPKRR